MKVIVTRSDTGKIEKILEVLDDVPALDLLDILNSKWNAEGYFLLADRAQYVAFREDDVNGEPVIAVEVYDDCRE